MPAVALRMRGRFLVLLLLGVASGGPRRGSEPPNPPLTIGLILPKTLFGVRGYNKAITEATAGLTKPRGPKLEFLKKYTFTAAQVHNQMMVLTPSPTAPSRNPLANLSLQKKTTPASDNSIGPLPAPHYPGCRFLGPLRLLNYG
ncbi:unnamed protein product [Nezara viridula]|uniref:Neuropeptide n=1 Tax=Nezara viridula TaxID=85310 RepID=A0A9P0HDP5_NEZVI|nr:unnamed protein product [Nezara viridula]